MGRIVPLFTAALMALASTTSACTWRPLSPTASLPLPDWSSAAVHKEPRGFFFSATVDRIDYQTGLVHLETEVGAFYARVSSEDMQKLHEGDVIPVYAEDEEPPTLPI
jgi:hypothetical protein